LELFCYELIFLIVFRIMERFQIRVLLRHYWRQHFLAVDAAKKICQVEGEAIVSIRTAQKWFNRFNEGCTNFKDESRSGRPTIVDSEALLNAVEANPSTSSRRLSAELDIPQTSVVRHLHTLGKINKRCREVPHDLTEIQAQNRVNACRKLLENPLDDRFIRQIVTCDEKWVYFSNPDKRNQWLNPGQVAEPVAKRDRFSRKVLLCVWWNFEGVIHFELVPNGRTIDADLYCTQLGRMYAALSEKYPALVNRKRVLLQQDNAKPHTSRQTKEKIAELDGIELLPHPAYSPDLAPSDYHLFRSMAHFLRGRSFNNLDDVEDGCRAFFGSKDKEWYRHGIEQLSNRWVQTIESNGVYFET
jgi:[histone H3]-lysine36 N-dimethyltransferase SETMAR